MRRRLFTLVSAVSLVLCVASCVLWAWSHRVPGSQKRLDLSWSSVDVVVRRQTLTSDRGQLAYQVEEVHRTPYWAGKQSEAYDTRRIGRWVWEGVVNPERGRWHALGVSVQNDAWEEEWSWGVSVDLPYWVAALATAVAPVRWAILWRRERRRRSRLAASRCTACGYDLRGSPGRCPECGTASPGDEPAPPPPGVCRPARV